MNKLFFSSLLILALTSVVQGEEKETKHSKKPGHGMEMSKEERAKMADAHDKMAACLRSDKSMKDCHKEMKSSMPENGCPMMGHGKHGHHEDKDEGSHE